MGYEKYSDNMEYSYYMKYLGCLNSSDFSFKVNEKTGNLEDVFPNYDNNDRIGIVVSEYGGTAGAGALIMSAITRFYDFYRDKLGKGPGKYFIYPEVFVFNIGKRLMTHDSMDIWPPHKQVVVENDAEQILEAINDRRITRLIVEDQAPVEGTFLLETLTSAKLRITSSIVYSPTGRVENSDIEVTTCKTAEDYVMLSLEQSAMIPDDIRTKLIESREKLKTGKDGNVLETYRFVNLEDALNMLTTNPELSKITEKYIAGSIE